jgi:hypothetical protein
MNERLTALYEQAISEVWESRKGADSLVRTDGNPYIFYEEFAQLIIQKCISQIALVGVSNFENPDIIWTVETAIVNIEEHFGVKK